MDKLNQEQKQLILDFYFQCGEQSEIDEGRDLIVSNPEAAKLYADLESTLTDLDHVKYDACPDNLVDLTVARLKLIAKSTENPNGHLHQLLENEQNTSGKSSSDPDYMPQVSQTTGDRGRNLRPLFEVFAAAASIAIVVAILYPGVGAFRSHSRQVACGRNLDSIGRGFASYFHDNNSRFPEARVKAGAPWWKIGDQGPENQSNTRYPFMLVKQGYVEADDFLCKGCEKARPFRYQASSMAQMNDFPSRENISYSFSLLCNKNSNPLKPSRKIIAGDLNPVFVPVFQRIPCDPGSYQKMNEFEKVLLNDQIKKMMSMNHRGRGQNVLYCDGSVLHAKTRIINGDDIFTISGVNEYSGCETPSGENDIFLAP